MIQLKIPNSSDKALNKRYPATNITLMSQLTCSQTLSVVKRYLTLYKQRN